MTVAAKDDNGTNSLITALNNDGRTIVALKADPATHALSVKDGTGGSDNGPVNALHDANGVATMTAVSSVDGETIVVLYGDSSGSLLITPS